MIIASFLIVRSVRTASRCIVVVMAIAGKLKLVSVAIASTVSTHIFNFPSRPGKIFISRINTYHQFHSPFFDLTAFTATFVSEMKYFCLQ